MSDLVEQNVRTIQRIEGELQAGATTTDWLVVRLHDLAGQGFTLWAHVLAVAAWVAYNLWPGTRHFDPFPFPLLALIMAVEAIMLAILILVAQRRAALIAERRSQLALQINLLGEQETTRILRLLQALADHFGLAVAADESAQAMQEETEPTAVAEHIARAEEEIASIRKP